MNNEELKKAIDFYRSLVQKEIAIEKIVDGKRLGPRTLIKKDHLELNDIINPERSFLGKDVADDLDSVYVTTFRIGNLKKPISLAKTGYGTDIIAGIEMGVNLVKTGIIKNFDEISEFLVNYKIGIFDIFKEEEIKNGKRLDIRVYECIECAGLPNIGEPVCYFETGMIIGILRELTHKEVFAEEIRCWTSGYSFCHFDVEIKD
ncbi:V4R domain-containing protein [uncultured Methanobacterium sp.]|uniref:V4R domain-containing protein n=1 Tax=uncultured Methanobacterium sp. TaxID=176306 RepID=UPI002AA75505|nr:V4R domain-containing protein [uncultured Methanobacterium sp.]